MYTIDIDIGSTSTDGFFSSGDEFRLSKVLTTPHDLAECTMRCIEAGAREFDTDLRAFLHDAEVVRLSSTLATNLVVQRAGAKVGLIVSRGYESTLYGSEPNANMLDLFVAKPMVVGVDEEVDDQGRVVREASREEVLERVRFLVGEGARMVVVSLKNAWRNDHNETQIREFVRERYPAQFLRSVPVQLGTEVIHTSDDHARTNSVVLNAYVHAEMARTMYRIEDELRERGGRRPLLIVHSHGGSGRIAKTIALQTVHSGPAVAARGGARLAELMGIDRVLSIDMGGTSLDSAVIVDRTAHLYDRPEVDGVAIATPMVEVESIAGGGGSIAWLEGDTVRVGPRSAGLAPGPACFGRGGVEPTLTDANVILGFIRPDYFLGGALQLDRDRAMRAIDRQIATPLGVSVEVAASMIRESLIEQSSASLRRSIERRGFDPADFTMFVLGGNSALHACSMAEHLGMNSVIVFAYSAVFSAFGANITDVEHRYSHTMAANQGDISRQDLEEVITSLLAQARRDMAGEGFDHAGVTATIEFEVLVGDKRERHALDPENLARADVSKIAGGIEATWHTSAGRLEAIDLMARAELSHWEPSTSATAPSSQSKAVATRAVTWSSAGPVDTSIYDESALVHGAITPGPAIVETPITNYAIAPGWTMRVDDRGTLVVTHEA